MAGWYYFSLSVTSQEGDRAKLSIYVNNVQMVSAVAAVPSNLGGAGNSVVAYCGSGQRVWVQCIDPRNNRCDTLGDNFNTFSGVLLED